MDTPLTGVGVVIANLTNSNQSGGTEIPIGPTSDGDDTFIFTISNTNVIKFKGTALSRTVRQPSVTVVAQKITEAATATVSVLGVNTGLTAVVSVQVNKTEGATVSPDQPENVENVGIGTGYGG